MNNKKTAYVNTYQVYEQFKLKKELEAELKKAQLSRQVILDSLKARLRFTMTDKTINDAGKTNAINNLKEYYLRKEREFSEENEAQAQKYTDQVWEQLNQYVKDFGTKNKYAYILGANGQGSIMFANEENDITKDIIRYVNERFEGHN